MRQVVNGKLYDTEKAQLVASDRYWDGHNEKINRLVEEFEAMGGKIFIKANDTSYSFSSSGSFFSFSLKKGYPTEPKIYISRDITLEELAEHLEYYLEDWAENWSKLWNYDIGEYLKKWEEKLQTGKDENFAKAER